MNFFKKPYRYAILSSVVIASFTSYLLLDTFVLPKTLTAVSESQTTAVAANTTESVANDSSNATITDTSYSDENMQISIETKQQYDTTYYVVDIQVSDASLLKTALASDTYARNVKATTSEMATEHQAILAINGDYYGFRDTGFVLRNGQLYRSDANGDTEALVIDSAGNFSVVSESDTSAETLASDGAWQILSFGPGLVGNGEIAVSENEEVGQAQTSNPRTAIGQVGELHYKIIVADGRTDESAGLSLYQLAEIFKEEGCETAYNLDGGGSSTLWFNGEVINNPTSGRSSGERSVSDIVYFGYQ